MPNEMDNILGTQDPEIKAPEGTEDGQQNQDNQNQEEQLDQQEASLPTPTNLAEAFANLKKSNAGLGDQSGQTDVAGEQAQSGTDGQGETGAEQPESDDAALQQSGSGGGFANEFENFDPSDYAKELIKGIQQEAANRAMAEFNEKNYRKITVMDLRQQDEQGNVVYMNPDNQRRPFESRMQAQQWVDSFNNQVDYDFKQVSQKYQKELAESCQPIINLAAFVPTFNKMSKAEQDILDDLIEPYEIQANGQVIGYSCDLNVAARQAKAIAARYNTKNEPAPKNSEPVPAPVNRPATDLKGSGSSSGTVGDPEPKNIQEAMALYQKQQKEKRSK